MTMRNSEAMKKLRVIEKRIQGNTGLINQYASMVSTERPRFASEDEQKKELKALIQSNLDLEKEYRTLKKNIEYTNLMTEVEIDGVKYTLSDMLIIKRKIAKVIMAMYNALNTQEAERRMYNAPTHDGQRPQIVQLYNEKDKNTQLRKWQEIYDNVDSRLEVINNDTELIVHFE